MICEHCGYKVHDIDEYTGNEFLYCSMYNDKCIDLVPNGCELFKKRSSCKYFNIKTGRCHKLAAKCLFSNPEKYCDEYAKKDAALTSEELSIRDMYPVQNLFYRYPFMTKCLNKPYERKEEEMGEKCNNKVYFRFNDSDYVPFESIGEVTLVGGLVKSNYISCSPRQITPRKVIFSGPKTIVIWEDGTKTIVSCTEGQEYDEYAGFCAALAKKIFGTTAKAKRMMENRR